MNYCMQCGNQLVPGSAFCQSCGALANKNSSQGAASPRDSTSSRSSSGLKIVLIAVGVIVALSIAAFITIGFVFKRALNNVVTIEESKNGESEVSINAPGGKMKISSKSAPTEEQLGVPIYPGAELKEDSGSVSFSTNGEQGEGWFGGATFTTGDKIDQVVKFYQERLGKNVNTMDSHSDGKRTVIFNLAAEKGWRMVTVTEGEESPTEIVIASARGKVDQ